MSWLFTAIAVAGAVVSLAFAFVAWLPSIDEYSTGKSDAKDEDCLCAEAALAASTKEGEEQ